MSRIRGQRRAAPVPSLSPLSALFPVQGPCAESHHSHITRAGSARRHPTLPVCQCACLTLSSIFKLEASGTLKKASFPLAPGLPWYLLALPGFSLSVLPSVPFH